MWESLKKIFYGNINYFVVIFDAKRWLIEFLTATEI